MSYTHPQSQVALKDSAITSTPPTLPMENRTRNFNKRTKGNSTRSSGTGASSPFTDNKPHGNHGHSNGPQNAKPVVPVKSGDVAPKNNRTYQDPTMLTVDGDGSYDRGRLGTRKALNDHSNRPGQGSRRGRAKQSSGAVFNGNQNRVSAFPMNDNHSPMPHLPAPGSSRLTPEGYYGSSQSAVPSQTSGHNGRRRSSPHSRRSPPQYY
jgi:hypothetical protein